MDKVIIILSVIAAILVFVYIFKKFFIDIWKSKGELGENEVYKKLVLSRLKNKIIINDYYTYNDNGRTAQIDHIIIASQGVFCIETKNYSGKIYGDEENRQWTQVLNYGKEKNKFYNPLKQNKTHYYILKNMLPKNTPIYGVVVFVQNNAPQLPGVYDISKLNRYLNSFTEEVLSIDEINNIEKIIRGKEIKDQNIERTHISNIHEMQEEIDNNICPRCGGHLVIRESEYGKFYGCENYPKCKFKKKIDD